MPLQATSGAASYDAFGGGAAAEPNYIESCFSTYLYTGNGSTQTITNGIDLAGEGGLVWLKNRTGGSGPHNWYTTDIGSASYLDSSQTSGLATYQEALSTYNSDGFSLSSGAAGGNENTFNYASWTFRKQPKFFDVVTYTGNGVNGRAISHSLGSTPGTIIVKCTSAAEQWFVWHRSLNTQIGVLNLTDAFGTYVQGYQAAEVFGNGSSVVQPTSTNFTVAQYGATNQSGRTYVAYLFAHDAGGFGLTGTDNVISCGSYTGVGGGNVATITLGYEPQWILVKRADNSAGGNWAIFDNMRGMSVNSTDNASMLNPNLSDAESVLSAFKPTATGFQTGDNFTASGGTYIYIAIRRGPMKVPTSGTSVFAPLTYTGNGTSGRYISGAGFPPDLIIQTARSASENREFDDRLRGWGSTAMNALFSNSTNAEATDSGSVQLLNQDGFTVRSFGNGSSVTYIGECFRRAPSTFDVVCYTGTGSATTQTHNLTVVPELVIWKRRSSTSDWRVWQSSFSVNDGVYLNLNFAKDTDSTVQTAIPTSTVLNLSTGAYTNASGSTYVAYLFATCAGVSKVGSYTGNGSTQTIDCGFTGGARFVLIKRTDSTGDWYVYDTARGMTVLTDPYLLLNSTAAETATLGSVTTVSTGFAVNASILSAINTNAASYIFLAIA